MKIGDRVEFKKTGLPGTGTIVGVNHPDMIIENKQWDALYPDWRLHYVYTVKLSRPQKPISLAEYQTSILELPEPIRDMYTTLTASELELRYLNEVPFVQYASYPAEDLIQYER